MRIGTLCRIASHSKLRAASTPVQADTAMKANERKAATNAVLQKKNPASISEAGFCLVRIAPYYLTIPTSSTSNVRSLFAGITPTLRSP